MNDKTYQISDQHLDVIMAGLQNLPWVHANPVIMNLMAQANRQRVQKTLNDLAGTETPTES